MATSSEESLRQQRLTLQRQIADAFAAQNVVWAKYVRPHAASAKLLNSAPKGSNVAATKVVSMETAKLLDLSTPTGAFEYGRAQMESWNATIRRLRTRLAKVEREYFRLREEKARDARGQDPDANHGGSAGTRRPASSDRETHGLQSVLGDQRLGHLRRLVDDARAGRATLSGGSR